MLNAEERRDLERACLNLRSAVAAAFSLGADEDWVYALVEAGILDVSDTHITQRMQARNSGEFRPDGVDHGADRYHRVA